MQSFDAIASLCLLVPVLSGFLNIREKRNVINFLPSFLTDSIVDVHFSHFSLRPSIRNNTGTGINFTF